MKKETIESHISNNVNLYTVYGIFNALMVFAETMRTSKGVILSQCFLVMSIIIWGIIRQKIYSNRNILNVVFRFIFDWIQLIFVFHFFSLGNLNEIPVNVLILGLIAIFYLGPQVKYFIVKREKYRSILGRRNHLIISLLAIILMVFSVLLILSIKHIMILLKLKSIQESSLLADLTIGLFVLHFLKYISINR